MCTVRLTNKFNRLEATGQMASSHVHACPALGSDHVAPVACSRRLAASSATGSPPTILPTCDCLPYPLHHSREEQNPFPPLHTPISFSLLFTVALCCSTCHRRATEPSDPGETLTSNGHPQTELHWEPSRPWQGVHEASIEFLPPPWAPHRRPVMDRPRRHRQGHPGDKELLPEPGANCPDLEPAPPSRLPPAELAPPWRASTGEPPFPPNSKPGHYTTKVPWMSSPFHLTAGTSPSAGPPPPLSQTWAG
jgi:hypothetical protein